MPQSSAGVEVEGPDGNVYDFPVGTDKAAAIRYFKSKGIGVPKAESDYDKYLASGQPTSEPRPQLKRGIDFPERVGERIKSNIMRPVEATQALLEAGRKGESPLKGFGTLTPEGEKELFPWGRGPIGSVAGPLTAPLRMTVGPFIESWRQDPANLVGDIATGGILYEAGAGEPRAKTVAEARGRTVTAPPTEETLPPEQITAVEKANRGYQAAKAQIERRTGLEATSKEFVQQAYDNLQQTYKAARSALDARWQQFRAGMEGADLDPAKTFNTVEEAKVKHLRGSPASLTQFNNLVRELGIQEFVEDANGQLRAVPGTGALPFETGRVHYSAIGDKLAQGDLPGNVYQALKSVQEGLDGQLTSAADTRGLGKAYRDLKAEEHQFRSDWVDAKSPLAKAHQALDANFLEPRLLGRGNEYITKQLARYRKYGADPNLAGAARYYADEAKAMGAKKLPEVKELPQPKPPKGHPVARATARLIGKVGGGAIGSQLHHPLIGYGIGGELGPALVDKYWPRKPTVGPPPEE